MRAKLEQSRSYGTVYGQGLVRYEQDHKKFDATGNEIFESDLNAPTPAAAVQTPAPVELPTYESYRARSKDELRAMIGERTKMAPAKNLTEGKLIEILMHLDNPNG